MSAHFKKYYVAALYLVVGLLLLANAITVASGLLLALLPLSLQAAVLVSVYLRKPWAHVVVILWAVFAMISGAAMWLAIFFRGGVITQSTLDLTLRSAMLFLGLFFLVFARPALRAPQVEI